MKTVVVNLYKFKELSDEAKEQALARYGEFNVDYEWWDGIYCDAENIGIRVLFFDDHDCDCRFVDDPVDVAEKIITDHGKDCETYGIAKEFLSSGRNRIDEKEFMGYLQEEYRIMFRNEYEYLTSDEQVAETLISNEYDFTVKGEIY